MKARKKETFTITKFKNGMEDGEMYSNLYGNRKKYIRLPRGDYEFVADEENCYIVKNDFNGTIELMRKHQIEMRFEILEEDLDGSL